MERYQRHCSGSACPPNQSLTVCPHSALRIAVQLIAWLGLTGPAGAALAADAADATPVPGVSQKPTSESTDQLQEIVVTAQLRKENLQDVPISISVVSGDRLTLEHVTNISDLSYIVPNLDVAPIGLGQQIIAIRGVSGERGSSSLTGIYLDNIPVTGLQDSFLATYPDVGMFDLQRVEVLKGPQGTLFGEGAVGGVVHFVTNGPNLTKYAGQAALTMFQTDASGVGGGLMAMANLPLVQDVFGIRLAANVTDDVGWINQPSIGRKDINDDHVQDGRVEALWVPTSALQVAAMVVLHHGTAGASDIVNQGPPQDSNFTQGYFPNLPTDLSDRYDMYNLSVTYHTSFADFLSSTSYVDRHSNQDNTQVWPPDTLQDTVDFVDYGHDDETFAQEFRLTSAGQGPFKWVAGLLYKDTKLTLNEPTQYIALFNGGFVLTIPPAPPTKDESKSVAAYGDLSYHITPRLEIGAGLRYLHDALNTFQPGVADSLQSTSFDVPTWRAFVSYSIAEGVNVYSSVGTGFRSGGFNDLATVAMGAPETYGPEHDTAYELGIKSTFFEHRVSVDAAIYYNDYRDLQDTVVTRNAQGTTIQYTGNQQSAFARGLEWDAAWKATANWTLHLAGDVMTTRITEASPVASYRVGDPIDFVPAYSVMARADYTFRWSPNVPGIADVEFSRKGTSYDTLNGLMANYGTPDQVSAPPVNFLNVSVSAMLGDWTLTLFGRNLTDERGYIRPGSSGWQSQARPLNAGLTIEKNF